jgi:hypothetical protein
MQYALSKRSGSNPEPSGSEPRILGPRNACAGLTTAVSEYPSRSRIGLRPAAVPPWDVAGRPWPGGGRGRPPGLGPLLMVVCDLPWGLPWGVGDGLPWGIGAMRPG